MIPIIHARKIGDTVPILISIAHAHNRPMRLKWLLGVLFGGSLALIPYKSTCQCVKSVTRKCLEEKRTDSEQPNSNTLAVLTSFHSNFTNTKLKKHLAKHDKEYQEFVKLNEEFEKGQSQISYMQ